jgi:hypothetical protein
MEETKTLQYQQLKKLQEQGLRSFFVTKKLQDGNIVVIRIFTLSTRLEDGDIVEVKSL